MSGGGGGAGEGDMSMLKILGMIFYLLAGLALFAGVLQLADTGGPVLFMFALASAVSIAFFGAMCFVADDVRALVHRIAEKVAPEAVPAPAANACDWCGRRVAPPYKPCSSTAPEKLPEIAGRIESQRCREEIEARLPAPL